MTWSIPTILLSRGCRFIYTSLTARTMSAHRYYALSTGSRHTFSSTTGTLAALASSPSHTPIVSSISGKINEGVDSQHATARFSLLPALSAKTQAALAQDFKYDTMSTVQEQVLSLLPFSADLLVRAKTGTGKTLAFVIAALETALTNNNGDTRFGKKIPILILSPTRELASQISAEATRLLRYHRMNAALAVGGMPRGRMVDQLSNYKVDILVATPGRLLDILQSTPMVVERLQGLQSLIFDEADMLLEMGFKTSLDDILSYLPKERQTFLFSATLSPEVRAIANRSLRPGYVSVDTVPKNELETHNRIQQTYIISPYAQQLQLLNKVIQSHLQSNPKAKIIVFFSTTKIVRYLSNVFNSISGTSVMEIHSKLDQNQRARVAERYRRAYSAVLFTSDVSARGVDYPGVTLVIQMGIPTSKENYVHRIGRTGRAGNSGEAIFILSPFEESFLRDLHPLPLKKDLRFPHPEAGVKDASVPAQLVASHDEGGNDQMREMASDCYAAFLGFYVGRLSSLRKTKASLVEAANEFATGVLRLAKAPSLSDKLINILGISGMAGLSRGGRGGGPSPLFGGDGGERFEQAFADQSGRREHGMAARFNDSFQGGNGMYGATKAPFVRSNSGGQRDSYRSNNQSSGGYSTSYRMDAAGAKRGRGSRLD